MSATKNRADEPRWFFWIWKEGNGCGTMERSKKRLRKEPRKKGAQGLVRGRTVLQENKENGGGERLENQVGDDGGVDVDEQSSEKSPSRQTQGTNSHRQARRRYVFDNFVPTVFGRWGGGNRGAAAKKGVSCGVCPVFENEVGGWEGGTGRGKKEQGKFPTESGSWLLEKMWGSVGSHRLGVVWGDGARRGGGGGGMVKRSWVAVGADQSSNVEQEGGQNVGGG